MDRTALRSFWGCGDNDIIEFALLKARLNKKEKEVVTLLLDECMTQEQAAEYLDISTRKVQELWYAGADKLLSIFWVKAIAREIDNHNILC